MKNNREEAYTRLYTRYISEGFKCTHRRKATGQMQYCQKCYCESVIRANYKNQNLRRVAYVCMACGYEQTIEAVQQQLF